MAALQFGPARGRLNHVDVVQQNDHADAEDDAQHDLDRWVDMEEEQPAREDEEDFQHDEQLVLGQHGDEDQHGCAAGEQQVLQHLVRGEAVEERDVSNERVADSGDRLLKVQRVETETDDSDEQAR